MMHTDGYQTAQDLFGRVRIFKEAKPLDERATLVHYFHSNAYDKEGKRFDVSYIGYRLAHLKLNDLYYLKSVCEDSARRGFNWNKTFFGSLKVR